MLGRALALLVVSAPFLALVAPAAADDEADARAAVDFRAAVDYLLHLNSYPEIHDPAYEPADSTGFRRLRFVSKNAPAHSIARCREFLAKHPRSRRVADVLQALVGMTNVGATERITALVRLRDELPMEYAARNLAKTIASEPLGLFCELAARMGPDPGLVVQTRTTHPTTFTVHRVPSGLYVDALLDVRSDRTAEQCLRSVSREKWVKLGAFESTNDRSQRIEIKGLEEPGWYVVQESVAGFLKEHLVEVGTLDPRSVVFGKDLVLYVLDDDSQPRSDVTLTTPAGTVAPGPDGLMRASLPEATYVVVSRGLERMRFRLQPTSSDVFGGAASDGPALHVSTDRPLYRPGHTVHYKAVRRERLGGRLALPAGAPPALVEIRDPDARVLSRTHVDWNASGSISGSFLLADEPRLGRYTVAVRVAPEVTAAASFDVEAYAKPEFLVTAAVEGTRARPRASMTLRLQARYYFGAPVASAAVYWTANSISRNGWARFVRRAELATRTPFEDPHRWYYARSVTPDEDGFSWHGQISGEGRLGPDGSLVVSLPVPEDSDLVAWTIRAVVVDAARRGAQLDTRLEIPTCDLGVTAGTNSTFVAAGAPLEVRARVTAVAGTNVAGRTAELAVFRVKASTQAGFRNERVVYNESVVYDPVALERATTDASGLVRFEVRPRGAGRFGYRVRVLDDTGREADAWGEIVLLPAASATGTWTPWTQRDADVLPERMAYPAGATARVLVHARRVPVRALLTAGGASLREARWVELVQREQVLEVPLPEVGPNAFIGLDVFDAEEESRIGVEVAIVPVERLVDVAVRLETAELSPHGKARLVIETRQGGKPVAAEVALSIVDQALLALRKDDTPSLSSVFEPFADSPNEIVVERSFRDELRSATAGGGTTIGGALFSSTEDEGASPSGTAPGPPPAVRRSFPDTWHWNAHLATDANGTAALELDVPDALTRWRVLARAIAGADGFGQVETELRVTQPVVLRLVAPRFFVQGDKGTVTTVLTSEIAGTFTVALTAGGKTLAPVRAELAAGASAQHEWPLSVEDAGTLVLVATATGPAGGDAVELTLPVQPNTTRLEQLESGAVRPRWSAELALPPDVSPKDAWIEVHVADSTSLDAVQGALPYLADFPYGCVEQTMSRFLPTLVVLRAMERLKLTVPPELAKKLPEMVSAGLQRLYHFQHEDGGWGWWEKDETHPRMTAYALYGLLTARAAGVTVDDTVLDRGLAALREMEATPAALFVRALGGEDISALRDAAEPTDDADRAWLVLAGRADLAAQIVGRPPRNANGHQVHEVALSVRALAKVDRQDPRIDLLVDWLALQRRDGRWVSTLDTAHAIYALCEVCAPKRENTLTISVNGRELALANGRVRAPAVAGSNTIAVAQTADARIAASAFLRYAAKDGVPKSDAPLSVVRRLSRGENELPSGAEVAPGDEIAVVVGGTARADAELLLVECPIPAGCEAVVDPDAYESYARLELRDDRVCVAVPRLAKGDDFALHFRLRALQPGSYHVRPATAVGMYDPTMSGASEPGALRITVR